MGKHIFLVSVALMLAVLVWVLYDKWANQPEYIILVNPRGLCVSVGEFRRGELYQQHTCDEIMFSVSIKEWNSYERAFGSPHIVEYTEKVN